MTCIVGLAHHGTVTIGGDSAATNEWSQQSIRRDPKVFKRDGIIFGCTSSCRMTDLLRYALEIPARPALEGPDALEKYMITTFIDAVRACLKEGGYAKLKQEREKGGTFLIGIEGRLFCVDRDYQFRETLIGYDAIGNGGMFALGAFSATQFLEMAPQKRLEVALEAAAYHSSDTRPPFLFVTTQGADYE